MVLVFRDITERRRAEQLIQDALSYAENIIATLREPFIVLDNNLRIKTANRSFYETFHVSPEETENQFIYDLGNRQWDIPKLRALLEEVLSDNHPVHDFEVEHTFQTIGRKIMLLNACRFVSVDIRLNLILLAIEDITERKQAEEALREAGALQAAIFNSENFSSIATDEKGVIQIFNVGAERMLGYTAAEVMNKITPADISDPQEVIARAKALSVELGTPITPGFEALVFKASRGIEDIYELTYIRKDGSRFPAVVSVTALRDAQDAIIGYLLIGTDNTARKQAEEALREAGALQAAIFNSENFSSIATDAKGVIQIFNVGAERMLGYTAADVVNKFTPADISDPQEVIARATALSLELGTPITPGFEALVFKASRGIEDIYELTYFRKDGSRFPAVVSVTALRDAQDAIIGYLLIGTDNTARKQAEAAVEDSELRYRRLFETTHDAILILDASTKKILEANPFIEDLLGYSQAEFVGKELWQLGLFQDIEESKAAFRKLQEQGYIRYERLPLETKDGRKVEVEFVSNVYQVDHTSVIQCNIRDITERSRLERQTHEQAEALAELHQRKDEFLAMLSHELRNPLSAIFNALHILRLQDTENAIQQKAKIVLERQVGQMAHLIDDLLEVSRVITGRIQLHQERLEMRGIVERAIESARPLIDRRKHELSVSLPAEPIWLQGDPTRLEQVVVNLLNNAAKYTDEGGHIRLTAQQEGGEVVLRVRDTGVGIAPELLPRIFDLFTQADRTLDRSQGGLGIGLSLVQKLVELHGGTVEAHSAGLGQGSEFIVRLPALSPARESIAPIETAKQPAQTSRVLVVDDNVDAADMLVMMLQMFGHEVRAAYSGQTALETAVEYQPDFVLLDIGLPDMNGYEVARRLRQQPQTKDVRLIAMTGYGQDSDRQRSQEAGFDHHLVKPVEPQKLQDLLATQALVSG